MLTAVHQLIVAADRGDNDPTHDLADAVHFMESIAYPLMGAQVLFGAGLVVCWLLWFAEVRAVAERFAPGRLRYSPFMAVVGWFVPLGNLFLPKQIANDVWHASTPPGRGDGMAHAGLLHTWWYVWLVTFLTWPFFWTPWTETINEHYTERSNWRELGWYEFDPLTWINLTLHLLVVPTAVVTALYIRRLTAMQAAKLNG